MDVGGVYSSSLYQKPLKSVLIDTDSTFELDLLIASSDAQRGLFEQAVNLVQTWNRYEVSSTAKRGVV